MLSLREAPLPAPNRTPYAVTHSDAEWRRRLTSMQYYVLRQEGTERPFTHPLNNEHRAGRFACAGCALPVFSSVTKFDSGTGWPSFYAPIARAVGTSTDFSAGAPRTEVHCTRCGGHLGHVFNDGPRPTGKTLLHQRGGADLHACLRALKNAVNSMALPSKNPLHVILFQRRHCCCFMLYRHMLRCKSGAWTLCSAQIRQRDSPHFHRRPAGHSP